MNYGWEGGGGAQMGGKEIGKERVKKGVIFYEHTLTTKEEIESGSSRAVEERTSSSRKQKRVILGKLLCKERERHIRLDFHYLMTYTTMYTHPHLPSHQHPTQHTPVHTPTPSFTSTQYTPYSTHPCTHTHTLLNTPISTKTKPPTLYHTQFSGC